MATWRDLDDELAIWSASGEVPTFWWRDDDARAPTEPLERLIGLSDRTGAPLHLAVVPEDIDAGLKPRLTLARHVWVFQHGFAHLNHEPAELRASEVGVSRPWHDQERDLTEGWQRLLKADLPGLLPVFVPPWNRIAEETVARLPLLGYRALSRFTEAGYPPTKGPLPEYNGHIDPIHWKTGAHFTGTEKSLDCCLEHLRARRMGETDKSMPTCLVTHHLQTDEPTWDFMEAFLDRLARPGDAEWLSLAGLIGGAA